MAEVTNSLCEFRIRRVPEGIQVTCQTSADLEKTFQAQAKGRQEHGGNDRSYTYWHRDWGIDDFEITHVLFAVGTSKAGGVKAIIRAPRSKEQLQRIGRKVNEWLQSFYDSNMRPIDITVKVEARFMAASV